ncbi:MAG: bifunctional nuclease family protein [Candidatus Brocadiia bacterium]
MKGRLALGALLAVSLGGALGAGRLEAGEGAPQEAPDGLVAMTIRDVKLDLATHSPLVILESAQKDRALIIVIGHSEAIAILRRLREAEPLPRPMTHDLLGRVISRLGGTLRRIVITRLEGGTFYGELVVQRGQTTLRIDSRPSDAMALALRMDAGIFVAQSVLEEAGVEPGELPDIKEPEEKPPVDPDKAI